MRTRAPRYSAEETARRGDEIYDRLRPEIEAAHAGEFVAIDIESGTYEAAADELTACRRLRERLPEAELWLVRVGHRAVHHFGSGRRMDR